MSTCYALPGNYVAISGVMGSGKTTLLRNLTNTLDCFTLPEPREALRFLPDLFSYPSKYAFEAQVAFLVCKARALLAALASDRLVLVDRSLSEDITIFARSFYERNFISERAFITYENLARHFLELVPDPILYVHCTCDSSRALERVRARGRNVDVLYTNEHWIDIIRRYAQWERGLPQDKSLILDSNTMDWRKMETVETIAKNITSRISGYRVRQTRL